MSVPAEFVAYDKDTGQFTWKVGRGARRPGDIAGYIDEKGYRRIEIAGRTYKAHRLAWLLAHGEEPAGQIDHINGIKSDNSLSNLRVVSNAENQQNVSRARRNSKTGVLGVTAVGKKFSAHIWINGAQKFLGKFNTPEMAHRCYMNAKLQFHKGYVS